jgi:hypothetical protein
MRTIGSVLVLAIAAVVLWAIIAQPWKPYDIPCYKTSGQLALKVRSGEQCGPDPV